LKGCFKPCTIIFPKAQETLGVYKVCKVYENERGKDFEKCKKKLDIYVVLCLTHYGGIQNFFDEGGH